MMFVKLNIVSDIIPQRCVNYTKKSFIEFVPSGDILQKMFETIKAFLTNFIHFLYHKRLNQMCVCVCVCVCVIERRRECFELVGQLWVCENALGV